MKKVVVIGSASIDFVVQSEKRPVAGETVLGESFFTTPGGKGANQAVAASRLGASVTMLGCVGDDLYGKSILNNFSENRVDTSLIETVTDCSSGSAHIIIADDDNSIVVVKGANEFVTKEYVKRHREVLKNADIVMIQQEIPEETVEYTSELCEKYQVPLVLNPAPARVISPEVIAKASYITPNEHEASVLFAGMSREELLKNYANKVLITEGENGVRFHDGNKEITVPAYPVEVIDTTGAGDTFNAAFAVAVAEGKDLPAAITFANLAASLSIKKLGAQGGMPFRTEVEEQL